MQNILLAKCTTFPRPEFFLIFRYQKGFRFLNCPEFSDLYPVDDSSGVHPTGNIDRIAPDIVVELRSPDNASSQRTNIQTEFADEVEIEQVFVEHR